MSTSYSQLARDNERIHRENVVLNRIVRIVMSNWFGRWLVNRAVKRMKEEVQA